MILVKRVQRVVRPQHQLGCSRLAQLFRQQPPLHLAARRAEPPGAAGKTDALAVIKWVFPTRQGVPEVEIVALELGPLYILVFFLIHLRHPSLRADGPSAREVEPCAPSGLEIFVRSH